MCLSPDETRDIVVAQQAQDLLRNPLIHRIADAGLPLFGGEVQERRIRAQFRRGKDIADVFERAVKIREVRADV